MNMIGFDLVLHLTRVHADVLDHTQTPLLSLMAAQCTSAKVSYSVCSLSAVPFEHVLGRSGLLLCHTSVHSKKKAIF